MSAAISGNTEVGFVYASLVEFIHLWRSERDASIRINCKDGQATLSMEFNLGNPDDQHVREEKNKKKKKSKSATRTARNNARAARHQAATGPPLIPPITTRSATSPPPPARTVTSPPLTPSQETQHLPPGPHSSSPEREPEKKSPARSPPSATARQEDSPMDIVWQPSELNDTRAAEYATVPLSPGSPGILREADQHQDISSLPSPQLSSPRREPGRPEIPVYECSSEDDSSLGLEKLRTIHKCMKGIKDRSHRCRDWRSCTEEEYQQLRNWARVSLNQAQTHEEKTRIRSKYGAHAFACSLLRVLRKTQS